MDAAAVAEAQAAAAAAAAARSAANRKAAALAKARAAQLPLLEEQARAAAPSAADYRAAGAEALSAVDAAEITLEDCITTLLEAEGRSAASQARFHTAVASLKSASAAEQRLQATRSSKILLVECVAEYARTQFALVAALASPALAEKMRKPLEQKLRAVQKRYSPPFLHT